MHDQTQPAPIALSLRKAAAALGDISPSFLRRVIKKGELPYRKHPNSRYHRFLTSDLITWIENDWNRVDGK
jgi:hypothetical protein